MASEAVATRRILQHIQNLNSPDEKVSARAEFYLLQYYGVRALEPLLEACNHANPVVRFRAAWVLGYTHDPRAYETILRLIDDPEERVRYDATIALGILGDPRAIEPLKHLYLNYDETRPAGMAFHRMGLVALPTLAEVLRQGNTEIRWSVIQVLGNFVKDFQDERCLELLEEYRNDPDAGVRENALFWLEEASRA